MKSRTILVAVAVAVAVALAPAAARAQTLVHRTPAPGFQPTAAYRWLNVLLEASGRDVDRHKARPTILSRTMAIVLTAMYDAWAAYDDRAVGTRLGGSLRRPPAERTLANKEKAIAEAAYRALLFVYPDDADWIRGQMKAMGYDPDDPAADPRTPLGIGRVAAQAVIDYRKHDGANQLGDEPGGDGTPYADTSGYKARNAPDRFVDRTCWLPIPFADGKGGNVSPGFLTAHWFKVKPFALERADQFRPPPPPRYEDDGLRAEVEECIRVNAGLTLEQKAIVELMRDGPRSTGQSGHWLQFAQDVSRRDGNDLDRDVKLFFSVGNVVFDAFIATWEAKRFYDTGRPYWWVRLYHKGETVIGWLGPGKGAGRLPAESWHPYSPDSFVTPPFPGYTSGHAGASGAAARILELFTGSDRFGSLVVMQAGDLTEPGFSTAEIQSRDGRPASDVSASREIRLRLATFSGTAEIAATSRLWGGYHIRSDNDEGLILGRAVAMYSWPKYQHYFDGMAPCAACRKR